MHKKTETALENHIQRLQKLIDTEKLVHVTYKTHMNKKNETLAVLTKEREDIREKAETDLVN